MDPGLYQDVFNQMNMGLALLEVISDGQGSFRDFRILDVNPACGKIAGFKKENILGKTVREIFPRLEGEKLAFYGAAALKGLSLHEDFSEFGKHFEIHTFSPRAGCYALLLKDITAPRKTLQDIERKYRELADSLPEIVFEIDREGRFIYVNQAAFEIMGYTPADFEAGLNALQMFIPEERERAQASIRRILSGELLGGHEYTALTKDGRSFPVIIHSSRIVRDGQAVGLRGLVIDLRPVKQSEEMRREKEAAEAADQAKSRFLAHISHDLKTPLSALIGMIGILSKTDLSSEQREYIEFLQISADSLLNFVNHILDYSQIESGKLILSQETFEIEEVLSECLRLIRLQAGQKGLTVVYDLWKDGKVSVVGDPVRLKEICLELLNNAVKYTENGGIHCVVRREDLSDGRLKLILSVSDTGCGISAEEIGSAFECFSQLPATGVKKQGTGLGLSIVKGLLDLMGGTIAVKSEVGRGSTFTCEIPLAVARS